MKSFRKQFDRVIISCDNSYYKDFLPLVVTAWKLLWGVPVTVIMVTSENELYVDGHSITVTALDYIPIANQAKLARHFFASMYPKEWVLISDADLLPLTRWYLMERLPLERHEDCLYAITSDGHYPGDEAGKFPVSDLSALGSTFGKAVNPMGYSYYDWLNSLTLLP